MKKLMNPRLMLIVSMTIFGTLGIFVRNIPVSSGELELYRAVLAAVLIAVYFIITGQKAAILSYIDPLVAVLISVTILSEVMTVSQVIGGGLILGFTLYNESLSKTL